MKKNLTLLFTLIVICAQAIAQTSGGPDTFGYTWRNSNDGGGAPVYTWKDLPTTTGAIQVTGLSDDNTVGPFLLPAGFTFHYYWYDITKFWIGSNGYVIFSNGQVSSPFPVMPSTGLPNDIAGIFMSDLNFDGTGNTAQCWYWVNGANDTLIVSWIDVPFWQMAAPTFTGSNSFQAVFARTDSSVTYHYKKQLGNTQNNNVSVGIENNSGSIGLQNYYNPLTTPYVPINFSIKYYFPPVDTFTVKDASSSWANNDENGALFISKTGNPFSMNGEVKNTGNLSLATFNVNAKVIGPSPSTAIKIQDNTMVGPLTTSQTQAVSYTNTFNPTQAGTFSFFTLTQLPGDAFLGNDSAKVEIHVVDTTKATVLLTYDNGSHNGDPTGLSWSGGNGGAGIYIIPPFYPCTIDTLRYFILTNPQTSGFTAKIFDDDGAGGSGLTELFTSTIAGADIDTLAWNYVPVEPPVTITDGGFYVGWMMDGNGIAMGQDRTPPFSNRTFEILGTTWAIYRYRETEDLMINAIIKGTSVGIDDNKQPALVSEIFPNPVKSRLNLFLNETHTGDVHIQIYDIKGSKVKEEHFPVSGTGTTIAVDVTALPQGFYTLKALSRNSVDVKKFTVIK